METQNRNGFRPGGNSRLSIVETAALLGVSNSTVKNWIRQRYIAPEPATGGTKFREDDVLALKKNIQSGLIDRLKRRANKSEAGKTFVPGEYCNGTAGGVVSHITDIIVSGTIDISCGLFLLALNLCVSKGFMRPVQTAGNALFTRDDFTSQGLHRVMEEWRVSLNDEFRGDGHNSLLTCSLPDHPDPLGLVYQSLMKEGYKACRGSYYTPRETALAMAGENATAGAKAIDPSCGTGQFLLALGESGVSPENLFGIDMDPIAVRIARVNLTILFPEHDCTGNIRCGNAFHSWEDGNFPGAGEFDLVITNPPWGMKFTAPEERALAGTYPWIRSGESFSCFIVRGIELLRRGGRLSYLLPESILGVAIHRDIRSYILDNARISKIECLDRIFSNVFSSAIRLDLVKDERGDGNITVKIGTEVFTVRQERFGENGGKRFEIRIADGDREILEKLHPDRHRILSGNAHWALGIVTGNNRRFLSDVMCRGYEAIYSGREVRPFALGSAAKYIMFTPGQFQQCAPEWKYRRPEKLIYRFISDRLVFAYDDRRVLTLNSANCLIPEIEGYPMKAILALFNSLPYQFIFRKRFASVKVLRSHIEQLPLPLWDGDTLTRLSELAGEAINDNRRIRDIDDFLFGCFGLKGDEIDRIRSGLEK